MKNYNKDRKFVIISVLSLTGWFGLMGIGFNFSQIAPNDYPIEREVEEREYLDIPELEEQKIIIQK